MHREAQMDRLKLAADQHTKEKEYWLRRLAGRPEKSWFPYDHKNVDHQKAGTGNVLFQELKIEFNPAITSKLIQLSGGSDHALHIILAAAVTALLARYTGNSDIMIGAPVYRPQVETAFINTLLILRNRLTAQMTFKELLTGVRQSILEASENQNYPVEILIEQLELESTGAGFPLSDVIVLLENLHNPIHIKHIPVNMVFSFKKRARGITGTVTYNSRLYDRGTVERIAGHFINFLRVSSFHPSRPIAGSDFLTDEERKLILDTINRTRARYPANKTIHAKFAEQAGRQPHHTAVTLTGGESTVTYRQLNRRANGLAGVLRKRGVVPDAILGIILEPSLEMIAAILAVLKAGGAYLPIDRGYPWKE